jgi:CubicO group peptidase (beta-lactamase class C family)
MTHPLPSRRNFLGAAMAAAVAGSGARLASGGAEVPAVREQGCNMGRLDEADRLIAAQTQSGHVAAAVLLVRRGGFEFVRAYGKAEVQTPFLIASPTKPITVSAVMALRDRKQLQISDPVVSHLPQFKGDGREAVTIKHLLTHTSGLPDMLPENTELRKKHAPLSEFVEGTCRTKLLFQPGTKVSYQSMGILLAGAIVEKISGQPLPAFLEENIFKPLKMAGTSLGLGGRKIADMAQCQVPGASDWDWNSSYWRNLGAPWGGAHSTVHDLAAFIEQFTAAGSVPWEPQTRREMRTVQTAGLNAAWGLGWLLQGGSFGKSCSPATFGHYGSTGTVVWHDPESHLTCVLLTTRPADDSRAHLLGPVSDWVAHSVRNEAGK